MADRAALRVLHVYRTWFPDTQGGGEEVIRQACKNTRQFGIESRVFTLSPNPASAPVRVDETDVRQVKRHLEVASCSISLSATAAFREQAAWADILHYHFPWPFGDLLHLLNRDLTSKPTVITYHSDVVRQRLLYLLYRPLMRRFLDRVDRIVCTSPNYARSSDLLRREAGKVRVVPIGLCEEELPPPDPELAARANREFGDDFLFFVGVFRYYKGLTFLLEAAGNIAANIVIAGSGPEEETLKKFKREHRLDNVHFVGQISDAEKMSYLSACRAFVFPSHLPSESFGISLLEAAILGKPMISCEIGTGTTYVNIADETGLVVPPADPRALAAAANRLVSDSALAKHLGRNARERFESHFTGEAMGRGYSEIYRELVADGGAVP